MPRYSLVDLARLAGHVVHEQILAEGVGRGEVGLAAAHLRNFLDKVDQRIVAGQHERIDHDPGALALVYLFERLPHDKRIEAESVFVDAAVFECERRGFSVGDHDDLAHIFFLPKKNALGHAQTLARVRVIRADLHASELAERNFFGAVVEKHQAERVAGVLCANEMGERHGHALGGREAVLAVENHAVAAIEKDDGGARALVFALVNHEVRVGHFDGYLGAFTANGVEERFANVQVQRVAEFVGARDPAGLDAGGDVPRVVAAKAAAAQRAEQILERLEAEEINGLVGDLETNLSLAVLRLAEPAARGGLRRRRDLRRLLRVDETFVGEPLGEFVEEILHRLAVHGAGILQHFAQLVGHGVVREQVAFLQGAEDGFTKSFHGALGIHLGDAVELRFEAALQEKIAQALDELFQVDGVGGFAGVFAVADEFHRAALNGSRIV